MTPAVTISAVTLEPGVPLVLRVDASGGLTVRVELRDGDGVRAAVNRLGSSLVTTPVSDGPGRWATRPRSGGDEWVAWSALDTAMVSVAAAAARMSLREWLGGSVSHRGSLGFKARSVAPVLEAGVDDFDAVVTTLVAGGFAVVAVDPTVWGISAIMRLDAVCRVLQVGLVVEAASAGPLASGLAAELSHGLEMATPA